MERHFPHRRSGLRQLSLSDQPATLAMISQMVRDVRAAIYGGGSL